MKFIDIADSVCYPLGVILQIKTQFVICKVWENKKDRWYWYHIVKKALFN